MNCRPMTNRSDEYSPRRYFSDKNGQRVLIGLTIEETSEFETLDSLSASDDSGGHVASHASGIATTTPQERWLELYAKHDAAWRAWLVETCADRVQTLMIC
jgi:hypothetical protein